MLYSIAQQRLLAVTEAGRLGTIRTGAASGVATRYLARDDASVLGMLGPGRLAQTQLLAMRAVRPLQTVRVFGRDADRREKFAREMAAMLSCEVESCDTAQDCVRDAHIVVNAPH
ncbi:MAG: alanine dehydrogenase [Gammaproteobacteria bacterium]|jgi:alanine dehydrogenase